MGNLGRKKPGAVLLGLAAAAGVLWLAFWRPVPGKRLVEQLPGEDVVRVTVRETLEDGETVRELDARELTPEEVRELYRRLSEVKLRDLGQQAFSITGPERYYLSFAGDQDSGIAAIKLYGDKTLIFDRVYGDRPAIHKRYSIVSS